jgi:enoyl-CoA hydratase
MSAVSWRIEAHSTLVATMAHPPANALALELLEGLHAAMDVAEADSNIKHLVIESALPNYFAAGADIKHLATISAEGFRSYGNAMRAVNDRLASCSLLSIAAIDGLALGGGLELALACTMRVCAANAKLGLPEVNIGLIPGAGGTQRLPRLVGRGRAVDLMLTARQVGADEALMMGLADRIAADTALKSALELAGELSRGSSPAQLAVVRCVDAAFDLPRFDGAKVEVDQEQALFEHGEAAEGISAFVNKRSPRYG